MQKPLWWLLMNLVFQSNLWALKMQQELKKKKWLMIPPTCYPVLLSLL